MYLIIQIRQPLPFMRNPFLYASNNCFDDYLHNRLNIYDDRVAAQTYIETQQSIQQLNFLMLAFNGIMRNALIQALSTRNRPPIYASLNEMTYFAPAFPPQTIPHYQNRLNYDLDAAVQASLREPQVTRPTPRKLAFPQALNVPNNFHLAQNVLTDLKRGKFTDPIMQEEINIDEVQRFACVPVKGIMQIYKEEDLIQHIQTRGAFGNEQFRDIATNVPVKISDVVTLTPSQLKHFSLNPPEEANVAADKTANVRRQSR